MKEFIKMTLAAMLGFFLIGIIFFFFSLALIGSLAAFGKSTPVMGRETVLSLDMSRFMLAEQSKEGDLLTSIQGETKPIIGIWDAIQAINHAAVDPAVKFIYMLPDGVSGGMAEIEEFRTALNNFRKSGKPIISYIENPGNAGFYLASVSDKVFMTTHDGGVNLMLGISSQLIFLKDILDRLGVNVQLIRHGKYKSAGEMFVRSEASKENLEQNQEMINSIWSSWAASIAESREINADALNGAIDNLELNFPEDYVEAGLVDELKTYDEMKQYLCEMFSATSYDRISQISLADYKTLKVLPNLKSSEKIAVIYAEGNIIDGKEKTNVAGDRFADIIAEVRRDSSVKAVVFRVNSPGGSVLASEKIKNGIDLLKEVKPVVASYGDYAASGGYWISNNCNYIFSNASTLTGSIGVFSMIPDFSKTAKNIAHVNFTSVNSNRHSDMFSGMRPLDSQETGYMQASVERIYDKFTNIVAEGRDMKVSYVDSIAQGRVWAGSDALEIGLVDRIGTIEDALNYAASLAGDGYADLSRFQIVEYPRPQTNLEMIMEMLGTSGSVKVFADTPFENIEKAFCNFKTDEYGKIWARMPYEVILQ